MTIDEALNILEPKLLFPPEFNEAISVVKDAMNQYRAIGTIKGYKRTIEVSKENYRMYLEYKAKVKTYETIGTPEECRAAVEKQKEKKPIRNDKCTCPSCGTYNEVFNKRRNTVAHDIVYCWHCGQALKIFRSDGE